MVNKNINFFSCKVCGECCSGTMKVFLNPRDITLILEWFARDGENLTEEDLYRKRLIIRDERNGVLLPRLNFKSVDGVKFCPFLENRLDEDGTLLGLCRLHPDFKPLVCHLAPLHRTIDFEKGGEESYGFMPPHPDCPGCNLPIKEKTYENILTFESLPDSLKDRLEEEKEYFRQLWME